MSTPTQHPLISALDNLSMRKTGENGHTELEWSNKFSESVVQFYFQLVRIDKEDENSIKKIVKKLRKILTVAKSSIDGKKMWSTATDEEIVAIRKKIMPMFLALYKMIGQTRDIIMGKGEYTLTFIQIAVWYEFFPEAALFALDKCVLPPDYAAQHQYGSWKDIKYFCNFLMKEHKHFNIPDMSPEHPIIKYALSLMVTQLKHDEKNHNLSFVVGSAGSEAKSKISLAARWAPRATSKQFGWMNSIMARMYYSNYLETATSEESRRRADRKAKTVFRHLLSRLNRYLETTQVKQCDPRGSWSTIDHNTVTSITARKQKRAFQYVNQSGESRSIKKPNSDREECAKKYSAHIAAALAGDKSHKVRGQRVGVGELVKDAILHEQRSSQYCDSASLGDNTSEKEKKREEERNVINLQWADNGTQNESLGNMIACVDTSGSMSCDNGIPLYNAIGLGIRIAEKSALGKRIATFSATPSWVNLESARDFVACVEKVRNCNWGFNTNFHALLEMILNAIKTSNLPVQQIKNMVLCVLSDMQIDCDEVQGNNETMFELMKRRYHDLGMDMYGVPISPPHIVFWNLRKTDGFPSLTTEKNTTMMSGYSPVLLNAFIEKGMDALAEFSPETMFLEMMNKSRYDCLEKHMRQILLEEEELAQERERQDDELFQRKRESLFNNDME